MAFCLWYQCVFNIDPYSVVRNLPCRRCRYGTVCHNHINTCPISVVLVQQTRLGYVALMFETTCLVRTQVATAVWGKKYEIGQLASEWDSETRARRGRDFWLRFIMISLAASSWPPNNIPTELRECFSSVFSVCSVSGRKCCGKRSWQDTSAAWSSSVGWV